MSKRLFEHTEKQMKDALRSFFYTDEERKVFSKGVLKETFVNDEQEEESVINDVVTQIEDLVDIVMNDGFDAQTQTFVNIEKFAERIEDLSNKKYELKDGTKVSLLKDNSISSLGFFVQQTINRLVTKVNYPEIEAWKFVSRDLVMEDGTVLYDIVFETQGNEATTRVAEGGDFKTLELKSTEDAVKTNKGKVGVKVQYFEEAARRVGPQILKMLVEAAIADIKRFKAREALQLLECHAKNYFDGLNTAGSGTAGLNIKAPSGRKYSDPKKKNGALLFSDLTQFLREAQTDGFDIDTIFLHPLAYGVFYNEPNVKAYLKENANVFYLVPKKRRTLAINIFQKLAKERSKGAAVYEGEEFEVPQLITGKKLNLIVTPLVSFFAPHSFISLPITRFSQAPTQWYADSGDVPVTDILLCDSSRALTHLHDGKGIITGKMEDRIRDVTEIKFKTYYQFILDKNYGVFAFRNIPITNDVFDPNTPAQVVLTHKDIYPAS